MTEDTRRDWVSEGIIFGEMGNQIIMCSTLEGVPYFPDDVPIPPVGQDDAIQPEYMIMWSHKDEQGEQEYSPLGEFFSQVGYDMFASILADTIAKIEGTIKGEGDGRDTGGQGTVGTDGPPADGVQELDTPTEEVA